MNDPSFLSAKESATADAQAIIDTATAAAHERPLNTTDIYGVTIPHGAHHTVVDLEHFAPFPKRARGTYRPASVEAFIAITKRHQAADVNTTTVWVHPTSGTIVAVLNDHGPEQDAEWGDHRVRLQLEHTEEWKRWLSKDGKLLGQEEFAEHLQDGITEIATPPAAELLEIAQTMHGTTNAAWKSGVSIRDGSVQLAYTEEASAAAGRDGKLAVPETFTLVLAPFIGEEPVELRARLRWRVPTGTLRLGYKLEQPEQVITNVLDRIAARLRDEFPGVVYFGEPRT